ncbi:chemotaxis protein CheW [Desulfuromonas acetexigens]|uniref:Chemotaxis protein CheW n=1 Tax=Trichloromonas acetexigens TaxID=38815 RepID=A0A550JKX4_9BACT|nr:chemotaxis protein CheW [Desulfuromonas acetexigens]TRO83823.1 chemotaxis protein CheW [Desulfuromonas acetexigens]
MSNKKDERASTETAGPEAKDHLPTVFEGGSDIGGRGSDAAIEALFVSPFRIDLIRNLSNIEERSDELVLSEQDRQWLTFFLQGEEYAMDIETVNEIIKPREITDIPRVPDFILGIVSLRGIVVPVYDLARRLNLGEVEVGPQSRIIVCHHGDGLIGLLVDSIAQVVRLNERKIEAPPAMLSGLDREFIAGIGRFQGRMLILLQLHNVLNPELV